MNANGIDMTIKAPPEMTPEIAQQCFIIGLRALTYMYNNAVVVSYIDKFQDERNIKSIAVMNEDAAAVIKFVDFIQSVNNLEFNEKIKVLEEKGNEIIQENYNLKKENERTDQSACK